MSSENLLAPVWTYGLGFNPKVGDQPAELVFKTYPVHAARIRERLERDGGAASLAPVVEYLGSAVPFSTDGAFFGFDRCGNFFVNENEVEYRFPIVSKNVMKICLSVHVLSRLFGALLAEARQDSAPNGPRKQIASFMSFVAIERGFMHSHPLGGEVFAPMRRWLEELVARQEPPRESVDDRWSVPHEVDDALQTTWCAVASRQARRYFKDCCGYISGDARFSLHCLGDACDLSMYPDGITNDSTHPFRFDCHNLDGPTQQLTLLAGFAAMYQLAAKDIEQNLF